MKENTPCTLNEDEVVFMKIEADIGRCENAKHRIELEPEKLGNFAPTKRRKLIRRYKTR